MLETRLALARAEGGLQLPPDDLIALYQTQVQDKSSFLRDFLKDVIEGFAPEVQSWKAAGVPTVQQAGGPYAATVLSLPRAKAEARAIIADAAERTTGPVVIDGQKTDGVDSILREVRKRTPIAGLINKAHGKLFWCHDADPVAFADWRAGPELTAGGFWTAPGVFSADAVDPASAMLVDYLPDDLGKQVADFGAGWGFLSAHVLTRRKVDAVHLVEASHIALECARRNVTDARAQFHWADVASWQPPERLDSIVMNPPFHTGRQVDTTIGTDFIAQAARTLSRQGQLWLVANRHLPYEKHLTAQFAQVAEVGGDTRFKILHATRPLRAAASRA